MAMTLRLTDEETEALRRTAEAEGRSMQEVAREAVRRYTEQRSEELVRFVDQFSADNANLMRRLAK
jgi:predicted transcriptional regulator